MLYYLYSSKIISWLSEKMYCIVKSTPSERVFFWKSIKSTNVNKGKFLFTFPFINFFYERKAVWLKVH